MPPPAPVEKPAISGMLLEGARALGLSLNPAQADALSWMAGELARWSSRINLTAILDPIEMADKHILDSLSVLRALPSGPLDLLDAGTGAGFPGLPLALAREDLTVTLVDSVAKKVGFLKPLELFGEQKFVEENVADVRREFGDVVDQILMELAGVLAVKGFEGEAA